MSSASHLERYTRLFSAFNRHRAAAPHFRAVRFRPGFESMEQQTLLSAVVPPAKLPGPAFVGDFDGQPDLLTIDAGSNDLTLTSDFNGPNPVTSTMSSGGVDPSVAFAFSTLSGFDNLVVGNTGDGVLALFQGTSKGLTLESALNVPGLQDAAAFLVSRVSSHEVQFYVLLKSQLQAPTATEGPFFVVLSNSVPGVPPILLPGSITSPPGQFAPSSQGSSGVAQLVPLQESSLALIGTLLPLNADAISSAPLPAGETQAVSALLSPASGPVSIGQSLLGREDRFELASAGNEVQRLTPVDHAPEPGNPSAAAWQRYTLGTGDALEQFDREHPDLYRRSSDDAPGTKASTGENEGERATSAGTVVFETSTATASHVAVADVACGAIDLLCGDDSLLESPKWWRDDATAPTELRPAPTRSELLPSLALTTVVAGCLYFGAAGERGRVNGRRTGTRRRHWI
jgi:hypothetical protein